MKHFVIIGNYEHSPLIKPEYHRHICAIFFNKPLNPSQLRNISGRYSFDVFSPEQIYSNNSYYNDPQFVHSDLYDRFYCFLLSDPRTLLLSERFSFSSCMSHHLKIAQACYSVIKIMEKCQPDVLISSSYPHSFQSWIILKFFQYMRRTILTLERTPLLSRCWILEGFNQESVYRFPAYQDLIKNKDTKQELSKHTRDFVSSQTLKAANLDAKNDLSRLNLVTLPQAKTGKHLSLRLELTNLFTTSLYKLPLRIYQSFVKYRCYQIYKKNQVSRLDPSSKYISFFLHYQPERTSLPEGYYYAQQFHAIQYIASSLPPGVSLLVREHPTTWWRVLDLRSRNVDFYKNISNIPNVKFASMALHTFDLIDNSAIVATLTGKVGFQALLRNVPTIYFGLAPYRNHPYAFDGSKCSSLTKLIQKLLSRSIIQPDSFEQKNKDYLEWIESNSVSVKYPLRIPTYEERLSIFSSLYASYFSSL